MTAGPPDPRDSQAVEYVLGTLPPAEREAFRRELVENTDLLRLVLAWDRRLAGLAEDVDPVSPPAGLWSRIAAATGTADDGPTRRPRSDEVWALRRSRGIWRTATVLTGSLAAALAVFVAMDLPRPDARPARYIAVVNRSGDLPALIVRVDPSDGTVQVRTLAAETPPDRSLELWSIAGGGAPRSLGLVRAGATSLAVPDNLRSVADDATLAVSVEPVGGSKTGGPTGPVVYSGKLVREVP